MLKLSIKNILANKARLALTGFAIILGVSFVVASFVLSDGLRDSFGTLSKEIYQGTDLVVRDAEDVAFGEWDTIDESTVAAIASIEGVRAAAGELDDDGVIAPVRSDGTVVTTAGPPIISASWVSDPDLTPVTLVEGAEPQAGQFLMDTSAAEREGFVIGDTYDVVSAFGTFPYELSGLVRFGEDNSTNGAVLMAFDVHDLRTMMGSPDGEFEAVNIAVADGYTPSDIQPNIEAVLSDSLAVVNQQTLQDEQAAEFNQGISILRNVLLGFAGVSLFVSTFIIYNTFGIVLAQRVRELGLLRAIGADARQIRRSILVEAVVVGAVASLIGLAGGVGLNYALRGIFNLIGLELPPADLILAPRTLIIAIVLGVGVTVLSSLAPAARAARISPIAAMGDGVSGDEAGSRLRYIVGGLLLLAGGIIGALGLQGGSTTGVIAALALGAIGVFFGIALLSPLAAKPVIDVVAWPISKLFGVSGGLARKNAGRHPRRTATTAAALMIGLSLVTTALVVGSSLKAQISKSLETSIDADYLIAGQDFGEFPSEVGDAVARLDEVGAMVAVSEVTVKVGDDITWYNTANLDNVATLIDLGVDRGTMAETGSPALVLPTDEADDMAMVIGDTMDVTFVSGVTETVTLVATFTDESVIGGGFLSIDAVTAATELSEIQWIAAQVADGFTAAQAETAMAVVSAAYPQVEVSSSAEYRESIEAEIDQLLNIISALLALAIFIALLGIGLTLALAVVERTRELGLLRAVGMNRRQMRRMVRWEAAAIALFGAVLGVAVGLVFGWASVLALPDSFITTVSIPVFRLIILTLIAAGAGLVAALLPARRAGRLNVLEAIAMG